MPDMLSTDTVEPTRRHAYWVDMICSTYVELECDVQASYDFHGSILNHKLPGLELSVVHSRAQRVIRTPRAIAQAGADYFIVSLQTQGQGLISQDGRNALLSPGDFAIYDSTRPYTLEFDEDFEEIVLKLPRHQLCAMVRDTDKLTASTVSGRVGAGRLLINMINTLRQEAYSLAPASAAAVASGVISMLVAGIQSLPACGHVEPSSLHAYQIARIKQCIDQNLRDSTLSIEMVAARLRMSVGHLHRLFKSEALSPSQYLWRQRLEACGRELMDPRRAHVSIAAVAFAWGFNDAAHFSRAFRAHFNCSPREWRQREGAVLSPQNLDNSVDKPHKGLYGC